ncbi:MAG: DUF3302 domain-containing protein [Phycisphaeraceae bacterium]|nr:DUF3302 domain-containing protein [Phycisphaerales bacterium]TVQ79095.1 MAG: DUF3302 domain-containing protein [Phycisphaeraceae bacterium]TVS04832.1 MAG: DUF3302 domain-containing protein [Phycisphaerales bacterium]
MLEYVALGMLLLSLTALFYIFIFIHDLPHRIAKKRAHPQADAIHYACWLSLFTLHAIWPLVFLWAVSNRGALDVRLLDEAGGGAEADVKRLRAALAEVESRLAALERGGEAGRGSARVGAS